MSRLAATLVIALACSTSAPARQLATLPCAPPDPAAFDQDPSLPDGTALMDEVYAAFGLPDGATGTIRAHGKAHWPAIGGSGFLTEVYGPGHTGRVLLEFELFGTLTMGSDGETVWEEGPLTGVTIRTGWNACSLLREFGIARRTAWRSLYTHARTVGSEEIDGGDCWVVHLFPRMLVESTEDEIAMASPPDLWYVEKATSLPKRIVAKGLGLLDEPTEARMDLSDWRETDGVLDPHQALYRLSGMEFELSWTSIERGVELPEGFFAPNDDVLTARAERTQRDIDRDDTVWIEELEERHIASVRVTTSQANLQRTLATLLPEAMGHVTAVGATMTGPPMVRYHTWGDPVDLEAGMPVAEAPPEKGRVKAQTLPAGKAVIAWHLGPYEKLGETHTRISNYMQQHGLTPRDAPWEEYWTDPGMESDPGKWRTRVVYPVK